MLLQLVQNLNIVTRKDGRPQAASAGFPATLTLQEHTAHSPITLAIKQ